MKMRARRWFITPFLLATQSIAILGCQDPGRKDDSYISLGSTSTPPHRIKLGSMRRGDRREVVVNLLNASSRKIAATIESPSCTCLTVRMGRAEIEPGETVPLTLRLDFSEDPQFTGSLGIEFGVSHEGVMKRIEVDIEVM